MEENRPSATLEKWYPHGDSLVGYVYGHPGFEDGSAVVTSRVLDSDGSTWAKTLNTDYTLGEQRK